MQCSPIIYYNFLTYNIINNKYNIENDNNKNRK